MVRYHIGVSKDYVIALIRRDGAAQVLEGFTGTNDEAIRAIEEDGREVLPVGDCGNRDPETGRCLGHEDIPTG